MAVVIFDADHEQATVDRQRRKVFGQVGVDRRFPRGQFLFEVDPVRFVEEPTRGGLDDVRPCGEAPSFPVGA
ncbi:hypothetical protein OG738_09580 [Amycolatopsis sp. NBC_01488]|uniref:hypothetical protein n=1 Tax=Amycolatopsis sp. NBC_01488 TaxID=2903563 RepID=UPI002E2A70EB|nr:hypothetical protein [Amycolatopsis sp. NBC_01488]